MYDCPEVAAEHKERTSLGRNPHSCSKARYYNPSIGRFISEDKIGPPYDGRVSYPYSNSDPVLFKDPTGWQATISGVTGGKVVCEKDKMKPWVAPCYKDCPDTYECLMEHEQSHVDYDKNVLGMGDFCKQNPGGKVTVSVGHVQNETECLAYQRSVKCTSRKFGSVMAGGSNDQCKELFSEYYNCSQTWGMDLCHRENITWPYKIRQFQKPCPITNPY